jgi:hypothetical protein
MRMLSKVFCAGLTVLNIFWIHIPSPALAIAPLESVDRIIPKLG